MDLRSFLQADTTALTAAFERQQFRLSATARAEFYEMMGALLKGGKPLDSSLRELHTRYAAKKRPLASLLRAWAGAMSEGKTFATAMNGFSSETEIVILAAAEKSGKLEEGFAQAALVARSSTEILRTVRGQMTMPAIQIAILVAMLIGFSTGLAPELARSIPASAMDDSQRALFGLADVVAATWYLIVPILAAALAFALWTMPRYTGRLRPYLDRLPPWSIYRTYSSATFMIAMSGLIKAGVPIETAIRFIRQQSKPWLAEHLGLMVGRLRAGVEQGEAMDTGLMTDRLSDMVAIYSRTADFDTAISYIGEEAMKGGIRDIEAKAAFARTLSTIAIGLMAGWIFVAMMGISDAAQRANTQTGSYAAQPVARG